MLKEELDGLNSRDKEFTVIDTGAKYTLFISLSSVDSNQVAKSIYQVKKLLYRILIVLFYARLSESVPEIFTILAGERVILQFFLIFI
jgi:hypothetical protein